MSDAAVQAWVDAHAARTFGAAEPDWLARLRAEALASFAEQGFPTRKLEDWKYTNVARLAQASFDFGTAETDDERTVLAALPATEGTRLVFLDGRFIEGVSTLPTPEAGVDLLPIREALRSRPELLEGHLGRLADPKRSAFDALNSAWLDDGVVLVLAADARPAAPIEIVFLASAPGTRGPRAGFPRLLVRAGRGSECTIVQEHRSLASSEADVAGLTCSVGELFLDDNAAVEHVLLQHEGAAHHHVASLHVEEQRDARYRGHTLSLGLGLTRNDVLASMQGPGADCQLRGLFIGRGHAHVDNHTTIEHASPHCTSDELYKGILDDESRGVFRGRVIVCPGAQKTAALQQNPNLLLSKKAEIDTKPQLEIYADDVKCSHGSTIGRLDPDALFYLRARGLDATEARQLLTMAFAKEIGEALPGGELIARADALIETALADDEDDGSARGGTNE